MDHPFAAPLPTMEAKTTERWPKGDLSYEPKWDGFRALAWSAPEPRLDSRNQKPLLRYFPELGPALDQLPDATVVDCEIVVVVDGKTAFDHLQMRLHPAASRVTKLSEEIPAQLCAFDLLALEGVDLRSLPFIERHAKLKTLMSTLDAPWNATPSTTNEATAKEWFTSFEASGCDGIIAKPNDAPYASGKRAMYKIKHRRTVDTIVGGYRIHKDGDKIGSLLLGMYNDEGELHFIGHCSGFPDADRTEMLRMFEDLRSEESFDENARMPGGESRWSAGKDLSWTPVEAGVVVEISYDQLEGGRFRHATRFHRWRPDKDPLTCTMDQLERPRGSTFSEIVRG